MNRRSFLTTVGLFLPATVAAQPSLERALHKVTPICPRCGAEAMFSRPPHPITESVPVWCRCGWGGYSPWAV